MDPGRAWNRLPGSITRQGGAMSYRGTLLRLALTAVCLGTNSGIVRAADISGTISETMNITEDSRLTGDVTCTVENAPCLDITAPNVILDLNGFSLTGLADRQTGCAGVN